MLASYPRHSYRNECISAPVMFSSKSEFQEEIKIKKGYCVYILSNFVSNVVGIS